MKLQSHYVFHRWLYISFLYSEGIFNKETVAIKIVRPQWCASRGMMTLQHAIYISQQQTRNSDHKASSQGQMDIEDKKMAQHLWSHAITNNWHCRYFWWPERLCHFIGVLLLNGVLQLLAVLMIKQWRTSPKRRREMITLIIPSCLRGIYFFHCLVIAKIFQFALFITMYFYSHSLCPPPCSL